MKNLWILPFLLLMLAACGGYFQPDESAAAGDSGGVDPLTRSSGSSLSTDDKNEITPFLYRDAATGKAYLFFAADWDGSYDIYFSEMDSEGAFSSPVKMSNTVNTSFPEFSPVVFRAVETGGITAVFTYTNRYISFIRQTNGGDYIVTCNLDDLQNPVFRNNLSVLAPVHLSLFDKTNLNPPLLISTNGNNWLASLWSTSATAHWNTPSLSGFSAAMPTVSGVDGLSVDSGDYFLISAGDSLRQLFSGSTVTRVNNFSKIEEYSSYYDDRDPCIDLATMKVYFSSKRYGKGNWDLYRFNAETFDKVRR